MVDYTKSTGASGTMMIRDTGTYVEFWLEAGSGTYNYQLPWSYVINGVTSGSQTFRFEQGGANQRLRRWLVTTTQTVTFKIGNSGTSGLGGPTTFSHLITRSTIPGPPSAVTLTNVTPTSVYATWSDGATNGAPIISRQILYGTHPTSGNQTIIASDKSTDIAGLQPGTLYYFWARTGNTNGFGPWGPRSQVTTVAGVRIKVGSVWKVAIPYVRVGGVWKLAHPWGRIAGVWKQTN
jgi:hypothetical protein